MLRINSFGDPPAKLLKANQSLLLTEASFRLVLVDEIKRTVGVNEEPMLNSTLEDSRADKDLTPSAHPTTEDTSSVHHLPYGEPFTPLVNDIAIGSVRAISFT